MRLDGRRNDCVGLSCPTFAPPTHLLRALAPTVPGALFRDGSGCTDTLETVSRESDSVSDSETGCTWHALPLVCLSCPVCSRLVKLKPITFKKDKDQTFKVPVLHGSRRTSLPGAGGYKRVLVENDFYAEVIFPGSRVRIHGKALRKSRTVSALLLLHPMFELSTKNHPRCRKRSSPRSACRSTNADTCGAAVAVSMSMCTLSGTWAP